MTGANDLLAAIRKLLGGYEHWAGSPKRTDIKRNKIRIYGGEGRYDPARRNGIVSKHAPAILNFEIFCDQSAEVSGYSIGLFFTEGSGLGLMFHFDADKENWPEHPLYHLHVMLDGDVAGAGAALNVMRLPFAEIHPVKILEYLVSLCFGTAPPETGSTSTTE